MSLSVKIEENCMDSMDKTLIKPTISKRRRGKIGRFSRYWLIRLTRLQGHPREIARGLAVGVFSGFFPWFGLQIFIAIFFAFIVRGNKIAAAAATWVSNPLTYIPLFAFNYKVGEWLSGKPDNPIDFSSFKPDETFITSLLNLGGDFLITMFIGCLLTGIIAAIITYFISLRFLLKWRESRREKLTSTFENN
ncbi:MAG: hypothetical protein N5P05_003852 [Chroococcopsis gigantea SAG 12.99]|nr:hypothetical protein [Chroococcopsis gigantea SAG 12.99]